MPIAAQLGAPAELIPVCAAAVVLTGLLGAALAQKLLDAGKFKVRRPTLKPDLARPTRSPAHRHLARIACRAWQDPITRGLATAGSAHGLGTAALAAAEPEALPFCALAYGLIGIAASSWVAVPPVRIGLAKLAGV